MRIGIDARFFGPIGKGLGRYTQKLIEHLEKIDSSNQYFVFLRKENFNDYKPSNNNFTKVLADYRWYTWQEQLYFPRLLNRYELDLIHFPHFNVPLFYFKKFVVTIHDLILLHFPTVKNSTLSPFIYRLKYLAYKIVIKSAIYRSNRVIAVSEFTKKDILARYKKIPEEKITVTYEACESYCMLSPNKDKEILARYGIIKPYIIYVGNVYPHKNPDNLILAFSKVRQKMKGLFLVFVGSDDYFYSRLKELVTREKTEGIIFPGFIPDYELDVVFHNALAYVRPSFYEGFELPPLEAMSKGVPVISSSHACALEILGDSAFYFDPYNTDDMAEAIKKIATDESLRQELKEKGYRQAAKYSWKKMARDTLELYQSIQI